MRLPDVLVIVINTMEDNTGVALGLSLRGTADHALLVVVIAVLRRGMQGWIWLIQLLNKWLCTGSLLTLLTPVSRHLLTLLVSDAGWRSGGHMAH